jgi:2-polyprenyl-6-methoxyphenol hydroxylase-like FAD-dependent oxidoreductase
MSTDYDVLVVGGRVAGASVALLLARAGVRVALVDRAPYGADTVSTHALMRAGVLQLHRWGLLDQVVATGAPAIERTLFHYADGESVAVTIRPGAGVAALYAPRRQVLDRILVDAAAQAGVDVRHATPVTALLTNGTGRIAGARIANHTGGAGDVSARITVGADGLRSPVAREARAPVIREGSSRSAVLYRYYADLPAGGYEWAYGHRAAAGFIPTNEGHTGVFVSTTPSRLQALRRNGAEQAFATLLSYAAPRQAERVASAAPVSRIHGWTGPAGFMRRSWGPGWALVGDAGYYKDPITTHGMTDALRDAELLAGAILDTLDGRLSEADAFNGYQAARDQLSCRLFDVTEQIASYTWSLERIRTLLRQVSSAMNAEVTHLQGLPERTAV